MVVSSSKKSLKLIGYDIYGQGIWKTNFFLDKFDILCIIVQEK
jgi:hypothetical protein